MYYFISFLVGLLIYFIGKEIILFWSLYKEIKEDVDKAFEEDFSE